MSQIVDAHAWQVNIKAASNNPDVTIGTGSSQRFAFDGSNWSTPQTVTVTMAGDADGVDDRCPGGFFGGPTLPAVTVM